MRRFLLTLLTSAVAAACGFAHFVYVVPAADGQSVTVVFSEDLKPDENVPIEKIASLKLTSVANGKPTPVSCQAGEHRLTAPLPAGTKTVYGSVTYGLMTRGEKPSLLVYHPKAVLTGSSEAETTVGKEAALEAVPVVTDGKVKFRLLAAGKPVADAEGSLLLPNGETEKVKTDKDGYTAAFTGSGRYAVWLRHTEPKAGEHAGQKYAEVRHYATLVVDVK